jgi:hypothetical protein
MNPFAVVAANHAPETTVVANNPSVVARKATSTRLVFPLIFQDDAACFTNTKTHERAREKDFRVWIPVAFRDVSRVRVVVE